MTKHSGEIVDLPQPGIPSVGPKVWTPDVSQVGTGFHVTPLVGMMACGNWALNPYHRRGLGNFLAQTWRMFSGAYLRREYPKNEKALRKAIAECEVWCERENAETERAKGVLTSVIGRNEEGT